MWADIESNEDFLNYTEIADLAVDVIHERAMLPVAVGIFGPWGSGKSTMLRLIETRLLCNADASKYVFIRFDAWLYQGYDDARSALMASVASALLKESAAGGKRLGKTLRALIGRLNWWKASTVLVQSLGHIGVPGAAATAGIIEKATPETSAKDGVVKPKHPPSLPKLIDAFRTELQSLVKLMDKTVVVFVDNLDRCLPEQTIHTLETLRLFLSMDNTAFVIAADEYMIRHSVKSYFDDPGSKLVTDYIDKLIQVPIRVPQLGVQEIRAYLLMLFAKTYITAPDRREALRVRLEHSLRNAWNSAPLPRSEALKETSCDSQELARDFELADRLAPLLATAPAINGNPRIVKRVLNVIRMRSRLARRRTINIDEGVIAKLTLFERCASQESTLELYRQIAASSDGKLASLKKLEDDPATSDLPAPWKEDQAFLAEWSRLEPSLVGTDLRAAIYLSRETFALRGVYSGMSPNAETALTILREVASRASPAGKTAAAKLTPHEKSAVMEALISLMRLETDLSSMPKPFNGALILAGQSSEAAALLNEFCSSLEQVPQWLKLATKNDKWYSA